MLINFYKKIHADPNDSTYCLADSSLEQLTSGAYKPPSDHLIELS